jgi:hypothetical protein
VRVEKVSTATEEANSVAKRGLPWFESHTIENFRMADYSERKAHILASAIRKRSSAFQTALGEQGHLELMLFLGSTNRGREDDANGAVPWSVR